MVFAFDPPTLLLVYHLVAWLMVLATAGGLWHLRGRFGVGFWVASFFVVALSQALRPWIAEHWSLSISLTSGHVGGLVSAALLLMAVRVFLGLKPLWHTNLIIVLMGAAYSLYVTSTGQPNWNSLVVTLVLSALLRAWAWVHAWQAWRRQRSFPWLLTHVFLGVSAIAHAWRAIDIMPTPETTELSAHLANGPWLLVFIVLLIAQGISILLLISDAFQREIQQLAEHDWLTGLLNRRGLYARIGGIEAQASRIGQTAPREVLLVDVDRFKSVNDIHGHDAGDAVLRQLGARLLPLSAQTAAIARTGGEEFVLVAYGIAPAALELLARQIVQDVRDRPFQIALGAQGVATLGVTVSIGVTQSGVNESFEAQLRRADAALYRAKNEGRDRWVLA